MCSAIPRRTKASSCRFPAATASRPCARPRSAARSQPTAATTIRSPRAAGCTSTTTPIASAPTATLSSSSTAGRKSWPTAWKRLPRLAEPLGSREAQQVPILLHDALPQLARAAAHLREAVLPQKRPHGVEDGSAVGVIPRFALLRRHAWVQRGAPAAGDDFDVARRVHPRFHRPQHLLEVRGVDVLVHDHHVASIARPGRAGDDGMPGLLGVAGVALANGDDDHVGGVEANPGNVLDAGGFELIPQDTGVDGQAVLGGSRPQRRLIEDHRVFTMVEHLHADDGLRLARSAGAARVVARPFTERALIATLHAG